MSYLGRTLIIIGIFFILTGIIFILSNKIKIPYLGRLPGDIFIKKDNFIFYFPLTTSIIVSIILSIIFYFLLKK